MIRPEVFSLKGKSYTHTTLRDVFEQFDKLDNAPGDRHPAEDKVDISSGNAGTQVLLQPGFFNKGFIEKVRAEDGSVTFREYQVPGFNPFGHATGREVSRSREGQYSGQSLGIFDNGYGRPFFTSDPMANAESAQRFNLLEARFQAEFRQG